MLLHPWDFSGKSTRVGCHFLLQRIFPTQGSNPGLTHCKQTLYRLSHQGSPIYTQLLIIPQNSINTISPFINQCVLGPTHGISLNLQTTIQVRYQYFLLQMANHRLSEAKSLKVIHLGLEFKLCLSDSKARLFLTYYTTHPPSTDSINIS